MTDKPCLVRTTTRQSRKAWIRAYGPIPEGMHVLHECDNVLCTEPTHLFLGTAADNTADMFDKGRSDNPKRTKITQDIIDRYIAGENTADLAKEVGCHRMAISRAARDRFGVHIGAGKNRH